ncbi:hypothetical protein VKY16_23325 [Klebsiella variicola]|uniref:hypothetical protein n=1 Tax=Klebsiella TaxID=570 RepID=UPI0010844956|nr:MULTISPECIES: hypothetical protein [Klebsiella]HDS5448488.1 hypothetical protein [Klebsiella pneumoniae subsp. pneumoniae]EIY5141859.1 hypothetical protein [Klebsiella variicola]KAA1706737.1 hypothetical protein F1D85_25155 [Klebsiella variicola]MDU2401229.1 hypothetical protein [Klebsiella sp.]MDU2433141.1 hypothetical protein [Klebsiella sp.]
MRYQAEITIISEDEEPLIITFAEIFDNKIEAFNHGQKQIADFTSKSKRRVLRLFCDVIEVPEIGNAEILPFKK